MAKWIIIIFSIIILGIIGFFALNSYIYNEKQADPQEEAQKETSMIEKDLKITPIEHATMVLEMNGKVIYTDPVGGAMLFENQPQPDIILITDIHGDHLDPETLNAVSTEGTTIIVPQAVADELPEELVGNLVILENGKSITQSDIEITAVPMYNVPETSNSAHTKGRGNGYVLDSMGQRIYIAGDTGNTPEMQGLLNIDVAFIPMNLPYTMSVEEAAEAVVAFKPKIVHPYHYRGPDGLADIEMFKTLVNERDPQIRVELLNFYPKE